jgi:glycosyltransferase involved in cell wall biosynthesis
MAEALRGFAAQPSVRVQQQTNLGVSTARNAGARASTGTFTVFLEADDELLPHALHFRWRGPIVSRDFDGGGTRDAVHQASLRTADRLR